jgi:hypothetical protein
MSTRKTLGRVRKTQRGFETVQFKDHYGHSCSVQQSSLAIYRSPGTSALWIGPNDAEPKVMARLAGSVGVQTQVAEGWVPYPIPEEVSLYTRMHLNRRQVAALIGHLQSWLDTGSLKIRKETE